MRPLNILRYLKGFLRRIYWQVSRNLVPPKLPANDAGLVRLHLGCGPISAPDYVNIDIQPFPHIHYVHDVYPLEIFPSNSVDLIYASHILEHYSFLIIQNVLKEWRRVLKPGGILRLGVPDFRIIIKIYEATGDLTEITGPLMGGQNDPHNFHRSVFDEKFLQTTLFKAGFSKVRPWDPSAVSDHDFVDTASKKWQSGGKEYNISLNLEAVK